MFNEIDGHQEIRDAVRGLCRQFPDEYFRKVDSVVIGEARTDRHLSGMGTTLTVAFTVLARSPSSLS